MPSRKGKRNKSTQEIKDVIDLMSEATRENDLDGMAVGVKRMFELAHGVRAMNAEGVVYQAKPDANAMRTLLEFRFGKPKETVRVEDPDEKFKSMPQVILVPPKGFKPRE